MMKRIYIAHPFQGKPENTTAIGEICRRVIALGHMPVSPVHAFSFLCDEIPEEREQALKMCRELVKSCDEIWLCGDWKESEGCQMELIIALFAGISVEVVKLDE